MPPRKTTTATTAKTPRPRKKKIVTEVIEPEIIVPPTMASVTEEEAVSSKPVITTPGEFYPTPRFYRTIALSFLGVALALILGVFYFTLGKAEINLYLKPKNVKADFLVGINEKNSEQKQISGTVVSLDLEGQKDVALEKNGENAVGIPSYAVGKVIIYNETVKNQTLVATTRLLSPENVLFRMKKNLVVPAKGSVESEVYADQLGVESEIGPTKFSIPGLSAELQKVIYAESQEKMTGGIKYTRKLTEDDIKTAGDELVKELIEKGRTQMIQGNVTSSWDASVFTSTVVSTKTEAKAGQEADNFRISAEVKITGIFYSSQELNKILENNLRDSLNDNEVVVGSPSTPQIEISKINIDNSAVLKVTQDALIQVSYLEDVIDKSKILGQKKTAVEEYFASLSWIEKAEIKLSPSWINCIPKEMNKVKLKVNQ
ncbi:MAG TPA: hypothetical protein PKY08_01550 [Candidatus Magasanikbacteria bacterium]|nr:hypothetical protein [Candidatus Magasanikbacteria bacterium]